MPVCMITGVAGFIGSHMARYYLERGVTVIGIDNFDPFYSRRQKDLNLSGLHEFEHFEFHEADIRQISVLAPRFKNTHIDILVHLAAKAGVRPSLDKPLDYADVNINGTIAVLEFARQQEIDKILIASSSSVYGNNDKIPFAESDFVDHPISPYAATKKSVELMAHTFHHLYQLNIALLRFFTVYGPSQRPEMAIHKFARQMTNGEEIGVYGDGSSSRDYTYIDDIVEGMAAIAEKFSGYQIFNIGESETTTLMALIVLLEKKLKRKAILKYRPMQPGDVSRTFADVHKLKNLTGFTPRVKIEEGIGRFVDWYLIHKHILEDQ
jgi:UDP-glucuronate 4-epimerase